MSRLCVQCGKAEVEPGRRKYCSDACRDTAERGALKVRKARGQLKRLVFRIYPKEGTNA